MSHLVAWLLALPPALVLLAAWLLPAAEASALVGLVVPGETAVFVAGLTAHAGHLPLWAVVAVAACGAVVGDQVGYRVGRRLGPGLVRRLPRRLRERGHVERATGLVRRRGGWAVLLGRWTAVPRALTPSLAGASGLPARTFTVFNVVGGVSWAGVVAVLGYLAGSAYEQVLSTMGRAGEYGLGAVAGVTLLALGLRALRRRRTSSGEAPPRRELTTDDVQKAA